VVNQVRPQGLPPGDASDAFLEAAFGGSNAPLRLARYGFQDFEDNNYNYTIQDSLLWIHNKHSFNSASNINGRVTGPSPMTLAAC